MFNRGCEEVELDKEIACRKCGKHFDGSRSLPCGKRLCRLCMDELVSDGDDNMNKYDESRRVVDDLTTLLDTLDVRFRDLKHVNSSTAMAEIQNYAEYLRGDIDLITESTIEYVNMFHRELTDKVVAYEKQCTGNIKANEHRFEQFQQTLADIETFSKEWLHKLNNSEQLDTAELLAALKAGKELLKKLQIEEVKQKRIKFNDKILKFKTNPSQLDSKLIGDLFYTTKIAPVNNQFVDIINLNEILNFDFDHVNLEKLQNETIVLICSSLSRDFFSRLVLLNGRDPWRVLKQSDLTRHRFDALFTCAHGNTLYTCVVSNFENMLSSLNEHLSPSRVVTLAEAPINSLACNSRSLVAWSSIGSRVYELDARTLEVTRRIDLNVRRPHEAFYMPRFVASVRVDERYLYLLYVDYATEDVNVVLMGLDGVAVRRFMVVGDQLALTDNPDLAVAVHRPTNRLVYYDVNTGVSVKERMLTTSLGDLVLVNSSRFGELYFFSNSEKSIYVYLS